MLNPSKIPSKNSSHSWDISRSPILGYLYDWSTYNEEEAAIKSMKFDFLKELS